MQTEGLGRAAISRSDTAQNLGAVAEALHLKESSPSEKGHRFEADSNERNCKTTLTAKGFR